ncbi:nascent polypeptide-associated complex protein [Candidatus Woesearchaeota archaeon]|nr:nascent polypeptide-associated complex protein [Candidatus Woesearchaeota archaeon]
MFPGMNARKMEQMMRKMGIQQVEIPAKQVVMTLEDKELVFLDPQVSKVNMMGQITYQLIGEVEERSLEVAIKEEDIQTVMEQADVDAATAKEALRTAHGDLAAAILALRNER